MLSFFGWGNDNNEDPVDNQQQVQVQIHIPKTKIPIGMSSIYKERLQSVEQNIYETQQILIDTLQIVVQRGENVQKLQQYANDLDASSAAFADATKKVNAQHVSKRIQEFVQNFKPELEVMSEKYQKILDELQKFQIQISENPEDDPDDPQSLIVYDVEKIHRMLDRLRADLASNLNVMDERNSTIDELVREAEKLLIVSEEYRHAATDLNKLMSGGSDNVYWVFMLDLVSSILSLINVTNETPVAVKTVTIARALFSFIVLVVCLSDMTQIPTSIIFGVVYILVTWIVALTNFAADVLKTLRGINKPTLTNFATMGLNGALALFITVFGLQHYVTSGGLWGQAQKLWSGFFIDSWYLAVVSLLSLAVSGVKLFELFGGQWRIFGATVTTSAIATTSAIGTSEVKTDKVAATSSASPEITPQVVNADRGVNATSGVNVGSQEPDEIVDLTDEPRDVIFPVSLNSF